jgi:hypothetical protein
MTPYHTDLGVVDDQEVAHLVIRERPEIVACLDGLQFHAGDEALMTLLRISIRKLAERIAMDLHEDATDPSESIREAQVRAKRINIVAKAVQFEVQKQGFPPGAHSAPFAAYRAETLELLHGPPPLIELSREERGVVARRAAASLELHEAQDDAGAGGKQQELRVLLDDVDLLGKSDFPYFVTKLPTARLFEWLARWQEESPERGDAGSEGAVVRGISERLERKWVDDDDPASGAGGPILPHAML